MKTLPAFETGAVPIPPAMEITHVSQATLTCPAPLMLQSDLCAFPHIRGLFHWSIIDRLDGKI